MLNDFKPMSIVLLKGLGLVMLYLCIIGFLVATAETLGLILPVDFRIYPLFLYIPVLFINIFNITRKIGRSGMLSGLGICTLFLFFALIIFIISDRQGFRWPTFFFSALILIASSVIAGILGVNFSKVE